MTGTLSIQPRRSGTKPCPWRVKIPPGTIAPRSPEAALRKAPGTGPGSCEVRLKVTPWATPVVVAVMTIGPAPAPARAVMVARPFESVVAVAADRVADPLVTTKLTSAPGTG